MNARTKVLMMAGITLTALASPVASALAAPPGKPTVERRTLVETYADDFTLELCGVETTTTLRQKLVIKTYPDGTEVVHVNAGYVPSDPSIATERLSRKETYAPDGTLTITGLAIRLSRKGEGTIIRDAGWIRFYDGGGRLSRGPHGFHQVDPASVYCG